MSRAAIVIGLAAAMRRQPTIDEVMACLSAMTGACPSGQLKISDKPRCADFTEQALALRLAGKTTRAIGNELGMSEKSVRRIW